MTERSLITCGELPFTFPSCFRTSSIVALSWAILSSSDRRPFLFLCPRFLRLSSDAVLLIFS